MPGSRTREALLEQGALLFARHGATRVTARQLHEAVGARNESALHYHFGGIDGLVKEIVRLHVEEVEARRFPLVAALEAGGRTGDLRALVHALAAPMAADLVTPAGRAHLRLVAQLSHPALAYEAPFRVSDTPAGTSVARWLWRALDKLPDPIRTERLALLRAQLISGFGLRAQLLDDQAGAGEPPGGEEPAATTLFVANMVDVMVAGLRAEPSAETVAAGRDVTPRRTRTARR